MPKLFRLHSTHLLHAAGDTSGIGMATSPLLQEIHQARELLARDAKRNIGDELLQAIRDVKAGNMGAQYSVMPNEIVEAGVKCSQNIR